MTKRPVLSALCLLLFQLLAWRQASAADADAFLELAEDAGRWVAATAAASEHGGIWPDDALAPDAAGFDLASGAAGKVVFFIALYRATGNDAYLDEARRGADFLVGTLADVTRFDGDPRRASLYAGVAGIGVALLHVTAEIDDGAYDAALQRVSGLLMKWVVRDADGVHWSEQFNDLLYGDAGTVLFLAHLARRNEDPFARNLARLGAHSLLKQSIAEGDTRYWLFRRDKPFNLPNFSHGTAGVAYVLATVGSVTGDDMYLDAAAAGFRYLRSIAEIDEAQLRIPYGWGSDNWQGLYEFGWAHGLSGTARLLLRLQQVDIDATEADKFLTLSRDTLASINLPGTPAAPFAEPATPLDFRFGRAGVLSLACYWAARLPGDEAVQRLCADIYEHIASRAVREGDTAHWLVDAPAFMGGGRAAYTGLLHGAAGIGLALLSAHAELAGKPRYDDLPDDPR